MSKSKFTRADCGCYADGALGHKYIRAQLARLVSEYVPNGVELMCALLGEMSDDASEEDEALELLQRECAADVCFEFRDGDLILSVCDDGEAY